MVVVGACVFQGSHRGEEDALETLAFLAAAAVLAAAFLAAADCLAIFLAVSARFIAAAEEALLEAALLPFVPCLAFVLTSLLAGAKRKSKTPPELSACSLGRGALICGGGAVAESPILGRKASEGDQACARGS